jgi:nitrous oxidase accessory protein NosD
MIRQIFSFVSTFALIFGPVTVAPRVVHAATAVIVVGTNPAECPDAQFSTIQAAVNAASPGTIIRICPGAYPEQVSITKSLSLHGENGVVIQPSNVTANSTGTASGQAIAAIILVQDATGVDIRDVIVDGTNSGITECAPNLIGVLYQNASGEVSRVAVRKVKLSVNLNGCQSGSAILVQSGGGGTSVVDIEDSSIHDYQKNGITANEVGTQVRIEGNVVTGVGATTGAAQNGIQIGFGAGGSITRNTVANHIWSPCVSLQSCDFTADDILVFQSDNVAVGQNVVGVSQTGIAISANDAQVQGNHIFDSLIFDGVELIGNDNNAKGNWITHSDRAGVFIQGNNNDVAKNRINEAAFGVLKVAGSTGNIIANNDFFNAAVSVQDPPGLGSKASPYR